jgi:hypothetical protein
MCILSVFWEIIKPAYYFSKILRFPGNYGQKLFMGIFWWKFLETVKNSLKFASWKTSFSTPNKFHFLFKLVSISFDLFFLSGFFNILTERPKSSKLSNRHLENENQIADKNLKFKTNQILELWPKKLFKILFEAPTEKFEEEKLSK